VSTQRTTTGGERGRQRDRRTGRRGRPCAWRRLVGLVGGLAVAGVIGPAAWAQEAALRALPAAPRGAAALTRAEQHARHAALWAACRACLIEAPAGPARATAVEGAPARRVSPYADQSVAGLPAVAVVEGRVTRVAGQVTADGQAVFTDYELVVERVAQNSPVLPTRVGATVLVTRPGGEVTLGGQQRVVSVAGYPTLVEGVRVALTLVAIPDAGSYQEVSLRPVAGKER
jgi:hypothetical protein